MDYGKGLLNILVILKLIFKKNCDFDIYERYEEGWRYYLLAGVYDVFFIKSVKVTHCGKNQPFWDLVEKIENKMNKECEKKARNLIQ